MDEVLDRYRPLEEFVGGLVTRQERFAVSATPTNHSIYEERYVAGKPGFDKLPHCIFFYYVRVNGNGTLEISHYFYENFDEEGVSLPIPRDEATLNGLMKTLALNARPTGSGNPPANGSNFRNIVWNRKSYIGIFIDEGNWALHKFANQDPGVLFITDPKDGKAGLENHTFFDAMDLDITMPIFRPKSGAPTEDQRSAIVFMNHMKADEAGNDLGGGGTGQFFQFKMFFGVKFADGTDGMTVIFDPGGTNMGPPLPPP
ncbi:MAG: hypothetical protein QOG13_1538 [Sphingomonadales bacterium]|jgi:hypothetical protein|nr:hypothetical protein [Sphingomonadales bacterium]